MLGSYGLFLENRLTASGRWLLSENNVMSTALLKLPY